MSQHLFALFRREADLGGRLLMVTAFLVGLVVPTGPAFAQSTSAQSTAAQWHRWELQLQSARDYHQVLVNGVLKQDNPYRKLTIRVTYTPVSCAVPAGYWCQAFTGYGFWETGRLFKIRGSFPAGTWRYTVTCTGISGNSDCSTDSALNTTDTINVANPIPGDKELFKRGFVRRSTSGGLKYLTYGDGQAPFFWRADTAWPVAMVDRNTNTRWNTFLADRSSKKFNTVMMGIAPDGGSVTNAATLLWEDIDQADAHCASPSPSAWPQLCSRWRSDYWKKLDEKIRLANEAGFLVVLIGVMDPQGNPVGSTNYPQANAAVLFARNLAARLAGDHVIFSPSFDDKLSTTRSLIDAVGNALRDAAPRHLLTAHIAGGSDVCDYYDLHNLNAHPWHQLHIFQSGHVLSRNGCLGQSIEDNYECAVRRARNIPDLLSPAATATAPVSCVYPAPNSATVKPNANGEAAYDRTYTRVDTQTIDSPYGVRHTGYSSALNGAFGVTLGVRGIFDWTDPSATALGSDGSKQMKILGDQFNLGPWQMLQRQSSRIKYQAADEEQDKKITMAATPDNNFVLIYLPDNDIVRFDARFLTDFSCSPSGSWSIVWINPQTGGVASSGSSGCATLSGDPTGATHKLTRPSCTGTGNFGDCDWVVKLRRKGTYGVPASAIEVWPSLAEDGSGWRIMAGKPGGEEVAISEAKTDEKQVKLPAVAKDADGKFFVVWESEDDGDLHGIFFRHIDEQGNLSHSEYAVNVTQRYDQTNPWIAAGPSGKGGVVTWTSYAQDGDSGGIFARLVDTTGVPYGAEIQVNEYSIGRQDFSKVIMNPHGGFVVAWTSEGEDGDGEGVYARRFDENGDPLGLEFRVNSTAEGGQWLTNLESSLNGGFFVSWTSYSSDGLELGIFGRRYDVSGSPLEDEALVVPPPDGLN
jgi:hypothetical protein